MHADTQSELGKKAGNLLRERLAEAGIVDELHSRILAIRPMEVHHADEAAFTSMFRDTLSYDALCFGYACLAFKASMMFTKHIFGFVPVPDRNSWEEFTDGVLGHAADKIGHPATRGSIIEGINDPENAVKRLCENYPPEATPILLDATQKIECIVAEILDSFRHPQGNAVSILTLPLIKFLLLFSFGLGATLFIGLAYPVFLITSIVVGFAGFVMGKSTKVPVNQREAPLSPMATLSYREFDRWARQNDLRRTDRAFFSRTDVHWTEKLPVLISGSDASDHCFEPSLSTTKLLFVDLCLGAFIIFPTIREAFAFLDSGGSIFFQFICGLALGLVAGRAIGGFYRWLRGKI